MKILFLEVLMLKSRYQVYLKKKKKREKKAQYLKLKLGEHLKDL